MTNYEQRQEVVRQAMSWLRTPYKLNLAKKGFGVDCGTFLWNVYKDAGVLPIDTIEHPAVSVGFQIHGREEIYAAWMPKHCSLVTDRTPLPGDILVYRFGRLNMAHAAIVTNFPDIIHANAKLGVVCENQESLSHRLTGIYSPWRD